VYGTGFGSTAGSLTINAQAATPTFWSDLKVICEVPTTAGTGPVVVTVGANSSNNNVVFTLATNGSITGAVSSVANGAAISGATVSLYLTGIYQTSTTSTASGAYTLSNLPPGNYSLAVAGSGFSTTTLAAVPVNAGGTTTENVALSTPTIAALTPSSGPVGTVVAIAGSYFGALLASSTVTFGGTAATPTLWSNSSITVPVPTGAKTGNVVVTVGGAASNGVHFTLGAGKIAGTITQSGNGSVVSGASVKAYQLGLSKHSTTSAADGTYALGSLAPGNYDVLVSSPVLATTTVSGIPATAGTTTTQNFSLSSTPGGIGGTVTQSNGSTAVSGATVNALVGYTVAATSTTSTSGTYTLGSLAAGTYLVNVTATGFNNQTNAGVTVVAGSTATANFSLPSQDAITYVYDQANRLAGVVDPLGNAAVYNYDTAGNIKSISQNPSSAISITEFTPTNGPIGSSITLYGTGFSATKSNDSAKFNGKFATVLSATTTQIVIKIPTGATTGTISVTSPAGTATTSSSFTITTSNGLPTITSFTPPIATPGTPVSIVGTNFDSVAANDGITVNLNKTFATSPATSTNISTSIPGILTTGHITVTTTFGASTPTSGYLFVPPPGYSVAQVGYTGQATLGSPSTVTLGTANQIGLLAIDVPTLSGLWITATNNFTSSVPYTIYDSFGNVIGSGSIATGSSSISTIRDIGAAGTCTIMLAPGNQAGNVVLSPASIPPDPSLPITVTASAAPPAPVTIATAAAGQSGHLTFTGTTGERLFLYIYNPTGTQSGASIYLIDPNGNLVLNIGGNNQSTWTYYSGLITLQNSGTFTIKFTPAGAGTYGATFELVNIPTDPTLPITITTAPAAPAPVTIATTYTGQSGHLTFTGTAQQRVYMYVTSPTGSDLNGALINMIDLTTNRSVISGNGGIPGSSTWVWYTGAITLPSTGSYSINITGYGQVIPQTYGATFELVNIPTDPTLPITLNGSSVTIATTYTGQSGHLTFSGAAQQQIYMYVTSPTGSDQNGALINMIDLTTNHSVISANGGAPGSGWTWCTAVIALPDTGNYSINFTPNGQVIPQTWGATFALTTSVCP